MFIAAGKTNIAASHLYLNSIMKKEAIPIYPRSKQAELLPFDTPQF
jgi:hypothetical protein